MSPGEWDSLSQPGRGAQLCPPHYTSRLDVHCPFTCWGRSGPGDEGPPEQTPRLLLSLSMGMGRLCSVGGKGRDIRWVQEQGHHCQTEMGMGSLGWGKQSI